MRKGLALVRYCCDLQASVLRPATQADGDESLAARASRLRTGRASLLTEMAAVGDASLQGGNANATSSRRS